jgi:hypothetical protein
VKPGKKPKKNMKPGKTLQKPERKCLFTKLDGHPKPDGFGFGCQISLVDTGSGVKFNPTTFFANQVFG